MTQHDQPPWAGILSGVEALNREVGLLRKGFDALAGQCRAEDARAEQRHRELLEACALASDPVMRLAAALENINAGSGRGKPGTLHPFPPRRGDGA